MKVKYSTMRGSTRLTSKQYYIALPQHERTLSPRETYAHCEKKTGYPSTQIRATFDALAEYLRENAQRGNISLIDEVASIRNFAKGAFETLYGPWVKGRNYLIVAAIEQEPFKSILAGTTLVNNTEGAKPDITSVFDETTHKYDVITGTNVFSIAGTDLGPDATKEDERVTLVDKAGAETVCTISYSDLQNVKAALATALPAGEYTLKVYTRSGYGPEFGVKVATRKVAIG